MKVRYTYFDVMTDSDLREILKEYSRWNSFPQLFIRGKFVGGLNFLEDNVKSGRISNYIPTTEILLPMREKIYRIMSKGVYMIFMRGTPIYPTCQQSRLMIEIFRKHYPWVL
jgi:glutaredoxin-related protein